MLLADEGYAVDGVDFSAAMVERARIKAANRDGRVVRGRRRGGPAAGRWPAMTSCSAATSCGRCRIPRPCWPAGSGCWRPPAGCCSSKVPGTPEPGSSPSRRSSWCAAPGVRRCCACSTTPFSGAGRPRTCATWSVEHVAAGVVARHVEVPLRGQREGEVAVGGDGALLVVQGSGDDVAGGPDDARTASAEHVDPGRQRQREVLGERRCRDVLRHAHDEDAALDRDVPHRGEPAVAVVGGRGEPDLGTPP